MALPPPLFEELEDVTLMLLTKRDRFGKNFTYSIANPEESVVYTLIEEEISTKCCDARQLPLKVRMMYEGGEVMRMERKMRTANCFNLFPYTKEMAVFAPAGNLIGHVKRHTKYLIRDENGEDLFNVKKCPDSLFGPVPLAVSRRPEPNLVVAHIGRRWMMEPLGDIRPSPLQRWGARYLLPMSPKEKLLVLVAALYADYMELSIDPSGHGSMVGRATPKATPPPQR